MRLLSPLKDAYLLKSAVLGWLVKLVERESETSWMLRIQYDFHCDSIERRFDPSSTPNFEEMNGIMREGRIPSNRLLI